VGSHQDKTWIFYPEDLGRIARLSSELKVSEIVARILINRGIGDLAEAQTFLRPQLSDLHDPFLLAGMEEEE